MRLTGASGAAVALGMAVDTAWSSAITGELIASSKALNIAARQVVFIAGSICFCDIVLRLETGRRRGLCRQGYASNVA